MRLRTALLSCAALPLGLCLSGATSPVVASPHESPDRPAMRKVDAESAHQAVVSLVDRFTIPYQSFTLPNGLRVIVHTDRRTPIVHVRMSYRVGARDEAPGRKGFAHLFEHMMFSGTANVPGDYARRLQSVGADVNGATAYTETFYYETVPTPALERALYMEADRLGHLREAITPAKLDTQRSIVKNETGGGPISTASMIDGKVRAALYPDDHPYRYTVGGSHADLDAATLDDVVAFHARFYVPSNAVLVLSGDIDLATARTLVGRYFADIPGGLQTARVPLPMTSLAMSMDERVTAPGETSVTMYWPTPGRKDPDTMGLKLFASLISDGSSENLERALVDGRKLFTAVYAQNSSSLDPGIFRLHGTVRRGVDPAVAMDALREEFTKQLAGMPTRERVFDSQAKYAYASMLAFGGPVDSAERLADAALTFNDAAEYKREAQAFVSLTPTAVMAAARRWLAKPSYNLTVVPGPIAVVHDGGKPTTFPPGPAPVLTRPLPTPASHAPTPAGAVAAGTLPAISAPAESRFPVISHAKLTNGIPVDYVEDTSTPYTLMSIDIAGGALNATRDEAAAMEVMYEALNRGYGGEDAAEVLALNERLGLLVSGSAGVLTSSVIVSAPDPSLDIALERSRDMLMRPAFSAAEVATIVRGRMQASGSNGERAETVVPYLFARLVDGNSPFNRVEGYQPPQRFARVDRNQVLAAYRRWVRPERARIRVISAVPLARLVPMLNRTIGRWTAPGKPAPIHPVSNSAKSAAPQIVLIDTPDATQATVMAGQTLSLTERQDTEAFKLAARVLSSTFTSRIVVNLRDQKTWTYGAYGGAILHPFGSRFVFEGKFRQDKVGPAIAEVLKELRDAIGARPITATEFRRAKDAALGSIASVNLDRSAVIETLGRIAQNNWPDSYPTKMSARYRAVSLKDANDALRAELMPDRWIWVVAGKAQVIRPQLEGLGLPVTVVGAADVLPNRQAPVEAENSSYASGAVTGI